MANAYTQDIVLDADGKPVLDALTQVRAFMADIQKIVSGIGITAEKDAKAWAQALASNLKQLKQAESDLRTLSQDRINRQKGFAEAERAAKNIANAEVRADKEANRQKTVEARVHYAEKQQLARQEANVEKQIAKEIADYEKSQNRAAIASAKEVAAARREAATAAVTAKARGITNRDDAVAAKAASDARLNQLRREREVTAANDAEAAKGIANRIAVERALGAALDGTIKKLNQQAEAERRAQEAATRRLQGQLPAANRLLAPGNVRDEAIRSGDPRNTLLGYQFQQELARRELQAALSSQTIDAQRIISARQRLELANANVGAAERLVREEQKLADAEMRRAANRSVEQQRAQVALASQYAREQIAALGPKEALRRATEATAAAEQRLATASGEHLVSARQQLELARQQQKATEQQARPGPLQTVLSPGYAMTAFARTSIYGAAAGAAYGVFNSIQGGFGLVTQMEDELAKLQAIANATTPQMQTLKAAIFEIGETSRYSTVDLIKISQTLAQAGVSASQMQEVLQSVTTLATASGSTPDEAVNLVTSALGAFQLQAGEAGRIADLMTSALNRTKLTVQQVGQAIQYVGATAFEQNISLEQLLATVGAVAQAGVRSGSTIGTGFRQFLVDLQTPSEKLAGQLKAVGLTANDVNVAARGLQPVLETLKNAGFGASQAYSGLETRAAAFYLVAKNNTAVMDQLTQSFALQGAAAIANERAMNSLTAQWQRFKNIVGQGFGEAMEVPMRFLQDVLRRLSDRMTEMEEQADQLRRAEAGGLSGYQKEYGNVSGTLRYSVDSSAREVMRQAEEDIRFVMNGFGLASAFGQKGLGDQWIEYTHGLTEARGATEQFEASLNRANEKVEEQGGKITELDKELGRLVTQEGVLRDNHIQTANETVTLTARFEGLAQYLTNTGNRYDDLVGAMQRYRTESVKTQQAFLVQQRAIYGQQADTAKATATSLANQALNDSALMGRLSARERQALLQPRVGSNGQVIGDAAERLNSDTLRRLAIELGTLATSISQQSVATTQLNDMMTQRTAAGSSLQQRAAAGEARLTTLRSTDRGAGQIAMANEIKAEAKAVIEEVNRRLADPNVDRRAIPSLQNWRAQGEATIKGVAAIIAPTKAEIDEQKRLERERKAREREQARKEKLVTQEDVDRIGRGLGLRPGSGTRTPEEQEALFRAGKTPARGIGPRVSNHVGGIARDFSVNGLSDVEAERYAATMRAQYRAAGINAQVQFENGKGRHQGTGRHIHVGVAKGATRRADRTEENEDRYDVALDRAQIALDEENLRTKLKDVARATTKETFDTSVATAKAALDKVNGQLKDAALNELAASGIAPNSPQFNARMAQVQQTITQNVEDFNQKVTDAIIKSTETQIKAAQTAFDKATLGAETSVQISQAQLTGLDAYSLRNQVPDYVRNLASDRVAQAQENVTRAQFTALPAQISAQEQAIAKLRDTIGGTGVNTEQVNAKLAEMNVELEKLRANRAALGAQLGAGGLLPQTLGQGVDQALQAYRQANPQSSDMKSLFLNQIGSDIGNWATAVQGGVSQIMDDVINHPMESLKVAGEWFSEFFSSVGEGSMNVLRLFGRMAQGIISYIGQIAAKAVAMQLFNLLLNVVGGALGNKLPSGATTSSANFINANAAQGLATAFTGGRMGDDGRIYRKSGGAVDNGSTASDSVNAKLARGEWVVQKPAVDSVGNQFMARLNQHGSKALEGLQSVPKLDMRNHTETSVWVVRPDQEPTMGPNDVRVVLTEELMNGEGRRLVEHISRESR